MIYRHRQRYLFRFNSRSDYRQMSTICYHTKIKCKTTRNSRDISFSYFCSCFGRCTPFLSCLFGHLVWGFNVILLVDGTTTSSTLIISVIRMESFLKISSNTPVMKCCSFVTTVPVFFMAHLSSDVSKLRTEKLADTERIKGIRERDSEETDTNSF